MSQPAKPNISHIRQRAELLRQLRQFFDSRGFLEVQPPCLSRDCVVDAYIDPIEVPVAQFELGIDLPGPFFLQTSPEAAMKRMLAAGAPSIYSLGPVFRAGERGQMHNLEFTMLEWYEVGAGINEGVRLLGELAAEMLGHDSYQVCSYRQLFRDSLGFDPIDADLDSVRGHVRQIDPNLSESVGGDRDMLLDILLSHLLQPSLGLHCPQIVKDYPLSQAALARISAEDSQCAARFELFVEGMELANGYDELIDADVLLERAITANEKRMHAGRRTLPVESTLIEAMRDGLPPCAGVALGVDRLLMIRTGEKSIADVMPFPIESA